MGLIGSITDPNIAKHLLRDEGEVIVDEVLHHWVAYIRPAIEARPRARAARDHAVPLRRPRVGAADHRVRAAGATPPGAWLREKRDRFVITNMRVFRVHGVLSSHLATMPLSRILDITVVKPLHGRILGFGHFVFESAAQEQGLRDIRYVGRPDERDLTIQRVVQRSGLRGPRVVN